MRLDIEFADGRVGAVADGGTGKRPTATRADRRRGQAAQAGGGSGGQGSLFG